MPARSPDTAAPEIGVRTAPHMNTPRGHPAAAGAAGGGSPSDDIVITGLSGRLPESNSIEEFKDQLFAGVDLVTADDRRWPTGQSKISSDCDRQDRI